MGTRRPVAAGIAKRRDERMFMPIEEGPKEWHILGTKGKGFESLHLGAQKRALYVEYGKLRLVVTLWTKYINFVSACQSVSGHF